MGWMAAGHFGCSILFIEYIINFGAGLLGPFGGVFGWDKNIFGIYYNGRK
jgi:hypothetical protein